MVNDEHHREFSVDEVQQLKDLKKLRQQGVSVRGWPKRSELVAQSSTTGIVAPTSDRRTIVGKLIRRTMTVTSSSMMSVWKTTMATSLQRAAIAVSSSMVHGRRLTEVQSNATAVRRGREKEDKEENVEGMVCKSKGFLPINLSNPK